MATRINVTAIRDCPQAEIRAVMSEVIRLACAGPDCASVGDQLEICEHGGWAWFITNVWGVSAGDLNRGLCKLARPALQFTTSDGERWFLTIHGGPRGQVHFLHEFSYHSSTPTPEDDAQQQARLDQREEPPPIDPRLAFLEEDRPANADQPKVPFDLLAESLVELGAQIPDEFRASVAHLTYSAAANRYRQWHAEQVSNALAEAGIPHDAAAVRATLLWENLAPNEGGDDLGNLPRLLHVLGLGGQWDEWIRQAEAPPPEPEPDQAPTNAASPDPPPRPPDYFGPVFAILEPFGLTPVVDGPVAVPLEDFTLIRFFVEALSIYSTAGVALTVRLPPGFVRGQLPAPDGEGGAGTAELTADGFRWGFDNHIWFNHRDLTRRLGEKLSQLLYHLPDGTTIDLAFALADNAALNQRYRGPVAGGQWQINETYPRLTAEALAAGMDLARYAAKEPEKHKLRDEAEAKAVAELARRDPNLWDAKVQQKGRMVWCGSDIVGHLNKVIFRHRFAQHWNVAAHDREADKLYEEHQKMQRQMRRAGAAQARKRVAPHDEEVLFQGKLGPCWRSDFAQLTELEQETREKFDKTFADLGFAHTGDLVAKKQRDIVLRSYISRDRYALAVLMAKRTMYLGYELFSRFADGSVLDTTVNSSFYSRPELKFYCKSHPGLDIAELFAKHQWGIERFQTKRHTEPVALGTTLVEVARELDNAIARRDAVAQLIRIIATPPGEPPESIRAAWIGCVLPLFATTDDPRVGQQGKGALTQQPEKRPDGFAVQVVEAMAALERHNPAAAVWWRENAPDIIQPGKLFVYGADVCEVVEEI